jgi:hypothetical protein
LGYQSESLREYSYSQCLHFDEFRIVLLISDMTHEHYLLGNRGAHLYNGNGTYTCPQCSNTFKSRVWLQKHSCNVCQLCSKQFSSSQSLKEHLCQQRLSSEKNIKKPQILSSNGVVQCQQCAKQFKT